MKKTFSIIAGCIAFIGAVVFLGHPVSDIQIGFGITLLVLALIAISK